MNWFERLFSKTSFATILAVVFQAAIFGFRHSYDFSERSITVGLIGLIMGIAYMAFGRNLWPLIIAHCLLNTISMLERVFPNWKFWMYLRAHQNVISDTLHIEKLNKNIEWKKSWTVQIFQIPFYGGQLFYLPQYLMLHSFLPSSSYLYVDYYQL